MKLEKYLVLNKYLLGLFRFSKFGDFKRELENKQEGFDNDGKSYFLDALIGLENLKIDRSELLKYDEAIKEYSDRLSENRRQNITLKYFQYIAILFAEIFLDWYFNKRHELRTLRQVNGQFWLFLWGWLTYFAGLFGMERQLAPIRLT